MQKLLIANNFFFLLHLIGVFRFPIFFWNELGWFMSFQEFILFLGCLTLISSYLQYSHILYLFSGLLFVFYCGYVIQHIGWFPNLGLNPGLCSPNDEA